MKNSSFANIIVIAIVSAVWCAASTVYHAQLVGQKFVYAGTLMTSTEVITNVWTLWALGVAALFAAARLVETSARKDREVRALARFYG